MKAIRIKATNPSTGHVEYWRMWREPNACWIRGYPHRRVNGPMWMLEEPDGRARGLDANWRDSIAEVRRLADCYGMTVNAD